MPTQMPGGTVLPIDFDSITPDHIARHLRAEMPHIWNLVSTKFIESPGTHYPYKILPVSLASVILETVLRHSKESPGSVSLNIGIAATALAKYDFPTYYVSSPLFSALSRTHPPARWTWNDIHFPYDAIIFMLPRGALREPQKIGGADLMYIGVCRIPANETLHVLGTKTHVIAIDETKITVFWALAPTATTVQDCTFSGTLSLEPSPGWIDKQTELYRGMTDYSEENAPDSSFSSYIAGLAANFLLVMQARAELVEPGKRTKKVLKSGLHVFEPTWLGLKYRVLTERHARAARTGAYFSELGWRSGHFKEQACGKGGLERKVILVDPYIAFSKCLVVNETLDTDAQSGR